MFRYATLLMLLLTWTTPAYAEGDCDPGPSTSVWSVFQDIQAAVLHAFEQAARPLGEKLDEALKVDKPDANYIVDLIHFSPLDQRRAILGDAGRLKAIQDTLSKPDELVVTAALMEGSQDWVNPPRSDFYQHYYDGKGTAPTPTSSMNCWEYTMFSALLAGQVDGPWVKKFYDRVWAAGDANWMVWNLLGYQGKAEHNDLSATNRPKPGQLVFWTTPGRPYPDHVALAISDTEALSLWSEPNNTDTVQRIKFEDLKGDVTFGDPPW